MNHLHAESDSHSDQSGLYSHWLWRIIAPVAVAVLGAILIAALTVWGPKNRAALVTCAYAVSHLFSRIGLRIGHLISA